jgi:hypothetical protein
MGNLQCVSGYRTAALDRRTVPLRGLGMRVASSPTDNQVLFQISDRSFIVLAESYCCTFGLPAGVECKISPCPTDRQCVLTKSGKAAAKEDLAKLLAASADAA